MPLYGTSQVTAQGTTTGSVAGMGGWAQNYPAADTGIPGGGTQQVGDPASLPADPATIVFTDPAAILTTLITLGGSTAIVFTDPAAVLTTAIRLTGSADVAFTDPAAILTTSITLVGSAAVVFTDPTAALDTAITLAGGSAVVFMGPDADLTTAAPPPPPPPPPPTFESGGGWGRPTRRDGLALARRRRRRRRRVLAVAQSLMDSLVRQYGIDRGVHIYDEMVRNELGPFAPGNKYGPPLDDA